MNKKSKRLAEFYKKQRRFYKYIPKRKIDFSSELRLFSYRIGVPIIEVTA